MSLAQILRRVAPEEQHDVQSCRNSSVSYHVNMAPCVMCDEGITIQHNAHFQNKRCQKWRQKGALLHRVDHVTVSRFFLARAVTTFAGPPKYRKSKMASHDLRARPFEDDYLCGILHGPLQLQIWTAFPFPAC